MHAHIHTVVTVCANSSHPSEEPDLEARHRILKEIHYQCVVVAVEVILVLTG